MKRILPVLLLTVSLVSSLAFSSFVSAKEYETGLLPIPVVNKVSTWIESNVPVHFGQNSGAVAQEGVFITPQIIENNHFDTVYMTPENVREDLYASTGYYHGGYASINTGGSYVSNTNFMGGPQIYMTFGEARSLAPGAAIEFYIWVGNVVLRKLSGEDVHFNCVGGVRLGDATDGGTMFQPDNGIKGIDYQITTYKDKSYSADANARRLCQKIKIVNNSNYQFSFTGMQIVFASTDATGNITNQEQYGFQSYYITLSISDFLTYNITSRNQEYLDSIGGTIGTFDDKFDSMNGSLGNLDNILDNWNNATWEGIAIPDDYDSIRELEAEGLSNARPILLQMLMQLGGDELVASNNFWQTLFLIFTEHLTPIAFVCAISAGLLIVRALMGR